MAAPSDFISSLVLWDQAQELDAPGDALKAIVIAGAGAITTSNGKTLSSATANGKSFSYLFPPGMTAREVLSEMEAARRLCKSFVDADAVETWLSTGPVSRTVVRARGFSQPYCNLPT